MESYPRKRVLISGVSGFLGRYFAAKHLSVGDGVVGFDTRDNPFNTEDIITGLERLIRQNKQFDIFYHFAANVGGREAIEGNPIFNAYSLELDYRVISMVAQNDQLFRVFVYPSSSAVYPVELQSKHQHHLSVTDFDPNRWIGTPDSMYGLTKAVGEKLIHDSFVGRGLNTHAYIIRPFSCYGPGQSFEYPFPNLVREAVAAAENGDTTVNVWGDGNQTRDFIYIDDLVERVYNHCISALPDRKGKKLFADVFTSNIGSGYGTSFNRLMEMILDEVYCGGVAPEIINLTDKPVGVHYRVSFDHTPTRVSLSDGIARMVNWVVGNQLY